MSLAASPSGPAASFVRDQTWRNWAGNVEAAPAYTVTATSEEEVADAVRFARAEGLKVRVVGTGHSWTGLGATDGVQINVQNLKTVQVADRDRKLATMGAGISIFEACEALWDEGFSLKNQGDIDVQTLAGAASTGTHGSGITLGNIASSIKRIRLVDGRGTPRSSSRLSASTRVSPTSSCETRSSRAFSTTFVSMPQRLGIYVVWHQGRTSWATSPT